MTSVIGELEEKTRLLEKQQEQIDVLASENKMLREQLEIPHTLKEIGVEVGLTDPVSGLNMGQTAEILANEFDISREEVDLIVDATRHALLNGPAKTSVEKAEAA